MASFPYIPPIDAVDRALRREDAHSISWRMRRVIADQIEIPVSATPTPTVTPTISLTPSVTPTKTPTPTPTPTTTPTVTPTISLTPTNTPTISLTPTNTPTISLTPSNTPTPTVTPTNTPTPTITPTNTPTISLTPSVTPTPTVTPTIPVTPSVTPTVTVTPTSTPTFFHIDPDCLFPPCTLTPPITTTDPPLSCYTVAVPACSGGGYNNWYSQCWTGSGIGCPVYRLAGLPSAVFNGGGGGTFELILQANPTGTGWILAFNGFASYFLDSNGGIVYDIISPNCGGDPLCGVPGWVAAGTVFGTDAIINLTGPTGENICITVPGYVPPLSTNCPTPTPTPTATPTVTPTNTPTISLTPSVTPTPTVTPTITPTHTPTPTVTPSTGSVTCSGNPSAYISLDSIDGAGGYFGLNGSGSSLTGSHTANDVCGVQWVTDVTITPIASAASMAHVHITRTFPWPYPSNACTSVIFAECAGPFDADIPWRSGVGCEIDNTVHVLCSQNLGDCTYCKGIQVMFESAI